MGYLLLVCQLTVHVGQFCLGQCPMFPHSRWSKEHDLIEITGSFWLSLWTIQYAHRACDIFHNHLRRPILNKKMFKAKVIYRLYIYINCSKWEHYGILKSEIKHLILNNSSLMPKSWYKFWQKIHLQKQCCILAAAVGKETIWCSWQMTAVLLLCRCIRSATHRFLFI